MRIVVGQECGFGGGLDGIGREFSLQGMKSSSLTDLILISIRPSAPAT